MSAVYRIAFAPIWEGQTEEDLKKSTPTVYKSVGVVADSIEEAIQKTRDKFDGESLDFDELINLDDSEEDDEELEGEEWKNKSIVCEKIFVLSAEITSFIDIE